jgi:hypothetical protein
LVRADLEADREKVAQVGRIYLMLRLLGAVQNGRFGTKVDNLLLLLLKGKTKGVSGWFVVNKALVFYLGAMISDGDAFAGK